MKKILKRIVLCACLAACIWGWSVLSDRERLNEELIRLHVVANSDSQEDQEIKLRVRDAIVESLSDAMTDIADINQAKAYILENLPKLEQVANNTLKSLGCDETALVSLKEEFFDTRYYDTFTLPAGIYEALRITIGNGEGQNWWCVVFPTLCIPATTEGFSDVAAGAGFPDTLTAALEGKDGYEIRFFLLDLLGKWESRFHNG